MNKSTTKIITINPVSSGINEYVYGTRLTWILDSQGFVFDADVFNTYHSFVVRMYHGYGSIGIMDTC